MPHYISRPCHELFDRMFINWEGKAAACCTDWTGELVYGDAHNSDLQELWNNKEISELRGIHNSSGELNQICNECLRK